jgi:hypothetical protein
MWWKYHGLMYENGKMRPDKSIPGVEVGGIKEHDGGVNSTVIYCKKFCNHHNVLLVQ